MEENKKSFIRFVLQNLSSSYSQNIQDLWGLWECNCSQEGFFVEFGALSGINASNSYLMEQLGWRGIVSEPHPAYKSKVEENRSCYKCYDAVYAETGVKMNFKIVKGFPALSTLEASIPSDNSINIERRKKAANVLVNTITLVDMLDKYNAPEIIDYISIDTEGSELQILSVFDFDKYKFKSACIEYGSQEAREGIHDLMTKNGYSRKWEDLSKHDDWYVHTDFMKVESNKLDLAKYKNDFCQKSKDRNRNQLTTLFESW